MKVLLNVDSLSPPRSGIGTYTFHLMNGLRVHDSIENLAEFTRSGVAPGGRKAFKILRRAVRHVPFIYPLRERISARLTRRTSFAREGYLYHEPNYIAVQYDGPCVVTISDLSHLHYPQYHPEERVRWLNAHLESSVLQAQAIICHSNFTRDEVVDLLGVPPGKVHVVYCGVDGAFRLRSEQELRAPLQRYGLEPGRYLLSVGTMEPRKNLSGLIRAYSALPAAQRAEYPLVIAGAKGWHTHDIEAAMRTLREEGSLKWLDYVPLEDLPLLYSGATLFAYLSFYEGFGLPVIEAMASGAPVVTSDRSAMPEIAGDAASLVNPEDTQGITAALGSLLTNDARRLELSRAGIERSQRYRWDLAVDQTVAVYRKVIELHSSP